MNDQHTDAWTSPARALPSRCSFRRIVVSVGIVLYLACHGFVIIDGREAFPLSCAAMFGFQVTPETPRYHMRLRATSGPNTEHTEPFLYRLRTRQIFRAHYGSADPRTYHHRFANDTPEAFSQRMTFALRRWAQAYARQHQVARPSVELWLQQATKLPDQPREVLVGIYDSEADTFIHKAEVIR